MEFGFDWQEDCHDDNVYQDEDNGEIYASHGRVVDDCEDEEDIIINRCDPLRKCRHTSLSGSPSGRTIAMIGAILDDEKAQHKAALDKKERGGEDGTDDAAIEYISMNDHLSSEENPTIIGGSPVCPKRPFEQWVDDVLSGKKTYDDPL